MTHTLSDVGAERAVLAGLFNFGIDAYVEVNDLIDHGSFGNQSNQIIYKCIEKVLQSDAVVDVPALLAAAKQLNFSDQINTESELQYIRSLMDFPVKKDNVLYFAAQIKKYEFARNAKRIAKRIEKNIDDIKGDESIDDIISLVESPLMDFLRDDDTGQRPEQLVCPCLHYIGLHCQQKQTYQLRAVPTQGQHTCDEDRRQ